MHLLPFKTHSTARDLRRADHRIPGQCFTCSRCHHVKRLSHGEGSTGYGWNKAGRPVCFACCGETDRADMIKTGRAVLYLTMQGKGTPWGHVSNWPGTLKIPIYYVKRGRHNIARTRYDFWFKGPDRKEWHGVQFGDWTQIAHCKRMKG